jgi:hypothetical protein
MKISRIALLLLLIAELAALPAPVKAQSTPSLPDSPSSSSAAASTTPATPLVKSDATAPAPYVRPSHKTKARNYLFDTIGPYPLIGAAITAGVDQATNTPPEWMDGGEGYGKRFGSSMGISAVRTTTRYVLAEAFQEDTLYYRCACKGFFPRLGHAVTSTFTARRGNDGHSVFSIPAVVAPYAGSMTAIYGWYPGRFGVKDGLRMGSYSLLGDVGTNIATEFIFGGPHSLLGRMRIKKGNRAPSPDSKP